MLDLKSYCDVLNSLVMSLPKVAVFPLTWHVKHGKVYPEIDVINRSYSLDRKVHELLKEIKYIATVRSIFMHNKQELSLNLES